MKKNTKIAFVASIPPPVNGMTNMNLYTLEAHYTKISLDHVKVSFSKDMTERGKMSGYKLLHFVKIVARTFWSKFVCGSEVLVYTPACFPKFAVAKDILFLMLTRFLFKKTVFHFHAAGISEEYGKLNWLFKKGIDFSMRCPDLAIRLSPFSPDDGKFLDAKKNVILANGIPDFSRGFLRDGQNSSDVFNILFVGNLNSMKGELILLDAIKYLKDLGHSVKFTIAGRFISDKYKDSFFAKVEELEMEKSVHYLGVVTGSDKEKMFKEADCFCLPSFYESESMPIVLLEALQFGLPVVGTKWRGIPEVITDGKTGFLVEIKNSKDLANKIQKLIIDKKLFSTFSVNARIDFKERFDLNNYLKKYEMLLSEL